MFYSRRELFQSNISIHTIEPGGFDTSICNGDRLVQALKQAYERAPEEAKAVYGGNICRWCKYETLNSFDSCFKTQLF